MLFSDSYFTVTSVSEAVYRDRGSKFFGFVYPVRSETEIKSILTDLRKAHPSARHHCYAWRLGPDKLASRSNDDGEPSGTAGKPIMGQIMSHDLTNVLVVVIRYFGGTLLGTAGLIHAYRTAADEAIKNNSVIEQFIEYEYTICYGFEETGSVMKLLKEMNAKIISNDYSGTNTILFRVRKQDSEQLEEKFGQFYKTRLTYIRTI
jgi:uncharacterized YigZ family protein